jgi:glycine betaine catabolism A
MMPKVTAVPTEMYRGLPQLERSLPSSYYYDSAHYEQELRAFWYANWIYGCRADALNGPRSFRIITIGSQEILLLRDETGQLQAFHNTCRHRGARLCNEAVGTLRGNSVQCPYHRWAYGLNGELLGFPAISKVDALDKRDYPLYKVAVAEWCGSVFVNLRSAASPPLETALRPNANRLANWPLAKLVTGHSHRMTLTCNWKVFWENFSECYHCPGVHPELSRLVPIYGRSIITPYDDPDWSLYRDDQDPRFRGGLREGAVTWSMDGQAHGVTFPGLTPEERKAGHTYVTAWPTMFVVGHVDYMRIVSLRPLGPEATELSAEWLFPRETLEQEGCDLANTVEFGRLVLEQDAAACELNQKGLRAIPHESGVLLPQEIGVFAFHEWIRAGLSRSQEDLRAGGDRPTALVGGNIPSSIVPGLST